MQHADALISISACAKAIGVHRSTLARQIADGSIRSHDGKVRISEVLEDRIANIDLSRSKRRDGQSDDILAGVASTAEAPTDETDATQFDDAIPAAEEEPVLVDGQQLSYKDARTLKENYLARLRRLEYQTKVGEMVSIEAVGQQVEREYSVVRERLLAIPGKMAEKLAGADRATIMRELRSEVTDALTELSAPAGSREA